MRALVDATIRYGILTAATAVCIVSAYVNAKDEEIYYTEWTLRYTYIWSALPLIVIAVYTAGVVITRNPSLNYIPTVVLVLGFAAEYFYYARNGQTDPDTAAHMHLGLVPILDGIVTLPILGFMIGRLVPASRKSRRNRKQDPSCATPTKEIN